MSIVPIGKNLNTEVTENLVAFPTLTVDPAEWSEENTDEIVAWVEHIRSIFIHSLKYDERRILEEDREQIETWLNTVFSASMTELLLDEYVPA